MTALAFGALTPGEDQRRVDAALHVLGMLRARAMTPADQVMVLMMAAASLIAGNCPLPDERCEALLFAEDSLGQAVAGAVRATERWLADLPAGGSA